MGLFRGVSLSFIFLLWSITLSIGAFPVIPGHVPGVLLLINTSTGGTQATHLKQQQLALKASVSSGADAGLSAAHSLRDTGYMGTVEVPHPGGLCGEWHQHLEVICTVHYVAVRLLAGYQALYLRSIRFY
eukprot:1161718-Pelagomonas_calceolata.AAC.10